VIGDLLGVPTPDRRLLSRLLPDAVLALEVNRSDSQLQRADAAVLELREYSRHLAARRRRDPADDLLSEWAAVGADGLDEAELANAIPLLFAAGFGPLVLGLGNVVAALSRNPAERDRLRRQPDLAAGAAEELLRYDSPVRVTSRVATTPCVLGGIEIARHDVVHLMLGAANRDLERFADLDRLDLGRPDVRPLSFGAGIHRCVGAALARLELTALLPALAARFPDLRVAPGAVRRHGVTFSGFAALPVTCHAAA
jgi:cytochrome P450